MYKLLPSHVTHQLDHSLKNVKVMEDFMLVNGAKREVKQEIKKEYILI